MERTARRRRNTSELPTDDGAACAGCGAPLSELRCSTCGSAARAGDWRILRVIAQTPHSRVYLARDDSGRRVALKELVFATVPSVQQLDAFEREAAVLAKLSHPQIPRFLGSFTDGTGIHARLYIAQEFIEGVSLAEEVGRLSEEDALEIAREVLEVLVDLHGRSPPLLHRDIKPANLILREDGSVVLVDFGVAREVRAAGTHNATLVGTFGYMAPEQLGGSVDARSDLYAVGTTLLHLLTGKPPEEFLDGSLKIDVSRFKGVSAQTLRLLEGLLAFAPSKRFASARGALEFLEETDKTPVPEEAPRRRRSGLPVMAKVVGGAVAGIIGAFLIAAVDLPSRTPAAPRYVDPSAPHPHLLAQSKIPTAPTHDWLRAKWRFGGGGDWTFDLSGRGHHLRNAKAPVSFDRTTYLELDDHPDYAFTRSMSIVARFRLRQPISRPWTIVSRRAGDAIEPYTLTLLSDERIAFSIQGADGRRAELSAALEPSARCLRRSPTANHVVTATLDADTGTMRLFVENDLVAEQRTDIRPAPLGPERQAKLRMFPRPFQHEVALFGAAAAKDPQHPCTVKFDAPDLAAEKAL